jgi:hypothetical protein
MSKLIRKIIKEAIDEFDWVNTYNAQLRGQNLYDMMLELFKLMNDRYQVVKVNNGTIEINDDGGTYYSYNEDDFTAERLREDFIETLNAEYNYYLTPKVKQEYLELAKVLEPIIGPINTTIKESEEFDWVDTDTSNLSGQRLADTMSELFKMNDSRSGLRNDIYWVETTSLGTIEIWDSGGYYLEYNPEDFTIDRVREDLAINIDNYNLGPSVRMDYSNLARALAPIIGPMEYYH